VDAGGSLPRDVAWERSLVAARVDAARGRFEKAIRSLEQTGVLAGPAGVDLLRGLAANKRPELAVPLAEKLLGAARLGGAVGSEEVAAIYAALLELADAGADPHTLTALVERLPDPALGFPRNDRSLALASLYERSGRFEDAVKTCVAAENGGLLEPPLYAIHIRSLRALNRPEEERRVLARLLDIAPHAILDPAGSPFARGAK
jgi:tetratricopeptide (TPR) repeat protein